MGPRIPSVSNKQLYFIIEDLFGMNRVNEGRLNRIRVIVYESYLVWWWLIVNRMVSNVVLVNHWINFHQLKKNRIFNRLWERINKTLKSAKRKIWAVWINWIRLNSLMMTHTPWVMVHDSFIWLIIYESYTLTQSINVKWAMNKSLEF